jgi:hypothetical protein
MWKYLLLIAMMMASVVCILGISAYIGAILFIAATFFQAYGGFGISQDIQGETRFRKMSFITGWVVVVISSVFALYAVPIFVSMFSQFGGELPLPTSITIKASPFLLLLPWSIAVVWMFWPDRASRLRTAMIFSWLCVVMIILMIVSLYLPILELNGV